jgi:ubiquinone biosynthesis protein COQ9
MSDSRNTDKTLDKLMQYTLRHVPFDGWTTEALKRGGADIGLNEAEAISHFSGDPRVMVEYFSHMIDRQMLDQLKTLHLDEMRIRDRIKTAVLTRLEMLTPYREATQKTAVFLSLPGNSRLGFNLLAKTVDEMWCAAGDTSTDFNYYSKRTLLSGVYSSTLIYWLNDHSINHSDTVHFLERRINEVMSITKVKMSIKKIFCGFRNKFSPSKPSED